MGTEDFLFQKGVFPYEYFTDSSKFQETELSLIDAFFNRLTNESLTDADYERALKVWNNYDMKNLQQYHDFYLTTDVLLLTDVFESFRRTMLNAHGLDCLHFPSLPSITLQMAQDHRRRIVLDRGCGHVPHV